MTQNNTSESASNQNTSGHAAVDERLKFRLPRLGCFWIFFIFFFSIVGGGLLLFCTTFKRPIDCETPTEHVTVSDPCHVLHEEDLDFLTSLANEVADAGGCDVAVLFVDEHFESFHALFDAVLADWAPAKGVLLMYGLQDDNIKMALTGGEWRLTGHDESWLCGEIAIRDSSCRANRVCFLLNHLKESLERAKNDDLPKGTPDHYDGVYFDWAPKVLPDTYRYTAAIFSLVIGIVAIAFGLVLWILGLADRKDNLARYRKVLEEFDRRHPNEPELELYDLNEPNDPGIFKVLYNPFLIILAILYAVSLGGVIVYFGVFDGPTHDSNTLSKEFRNPDPSSRRAIYTREVPEAPSGVVVDLADAFTPEEERAISEAVGHLEKTVGGQVQVLTVKTIGYAFLEDYTLEVASRWEIGEAGKDNGALLFLAIDDRRNRIEVGYGWEAFLTDARCGDLLRDAVPELREARYADACVKIIRGMEKYLAENPVLDLSHGLTQTGVIGIVPSVDLPDPSWDPRQPDFFEAFSGAFGILLALLGIVLGYWGRVMKTSLPDYYIFDPVEFRKLHSSYSSGSSSGGSSYGRSSSSSRSSSSRSSSSRSSSSHRSSGGSRRSGGGGSFGGGGASGRW